MSFSYTIKGVMPHRFDNPIWDVFTIFIDSSIESIEKACIELDLSFRVYRMNSGYLAILTSRRVPYDSESVVKVLTTCITGRVVSFPNGYISLSILPSLRRQVPHMLGDRSIEDPTILYSIRTGVKL